MMYVSFLKIRLKTYRTSHHYCEPSQLPYFVLFSRQIIFKADSVCVGE